ncbi:gene transfer agent family protein [Thermaurantiacus sp.]
MTGARIANPVRGEVALELGERTLCLRPSFSALVQAETELGSLPKLVERAAAGDVRLADAVALFWHCRAEGSWGEDRSAFEEAVARAGLQPLLSAYRALLSAIFSGA